MRHTETWITTGITTSIVALAMVASISCSAPANGPAAGQTGEPRGGYDASGGADGSDDETPAGGALSPAEATRLRRALVAWFECEECTEGQLEAVVGFGEVAVPSLVATLREGPSPAQREELRRHLEESWREIERYRETAEVELPEDGYAEGFDDPERYVRTYLDNYVALYRVRAARALAAIGGPRATEALRQAAGAGYREDVERAVAEALEGMPKPEG